MDGPCAACGSRDTSALGDAFGCQTCGAATAYAGGLVHGPTDQTATAPKSKKKK